MQFSHAPTNGCLRLSSPVGFSEVSGPPRGKVLKTKFTPEEDQKLGDLVKALGSNDWNVVAAFHGTRNARQCRERYHNYLSPSLRDDPWTPEEDALLGEKYAVYGSKWNTISPFFLNRSDISLRNRWQQLQRHCARQQRSAAKAEVKAAKALMKRVKDTKKRQYPDDDQESVDISAFDPLRLMSPTELLNRPHQLPPAQPFSGSIADFLNH